MDVEVVNPFLNAVVDVLSTMAQVVVTPEKPFVKKTSAAKGDITGIIGITGDSDKGTISVTFEEKLALVVVGNMLGEEIQEMNDEVRDAVGEITNMISGQARQGLATTGRKYHAAIPTVTVGRNHEVSHISDGPILAIPFTTPHGAITVEVCFGPLGI
ncbi:MAG: chemotaxis protein CheX [Desulfovibrio sp.]|nr:MAG: chemotaxis protein CheX [Desulfovibrio sp.]